MESKLDLKLLAFFVALYDKGTVNAAARLVGVGQPVFSLGLAKLRQAFKDELFIKTQHKMVPTTAAHRLIGPIRSLVLQLSGNVVKNERFDPQTTTGVFTFVFSEPAEILYFPKIFGAVRAMAPKAQARSTFCTQDETVYRFESGEIDLAIGLFPELHRPSFFRQRLLAIDVVCVMRSDHPFREDKLSVEEYVTLEHVDYDRQGRTGASWKRILHEEGARRRSMLEVAHVSCLPEIIRMSNLVMTTSRTIATYMLHNFKGLKIVETTFEPGKLVVSLYWHSRAQQDPKHQWLRKLVKDLFRTGEDVSLLGQERKLA